MVIHHEKYNKIDKNLLIKHLYVYVSNDGVTYVCKTCNRALNSGSLPAQAVANGLELDQIPAELATLKMLEIRVISQRISFMKICALPVGKQQCIHGPTVNVPSKLEAICTTLPRLPSETEILALKLKRKMAYKGHYLFDYINPQHVFEALRWLKNNNEFYRNIDINYEWVAHAYSDNEEIAHGLINDPIL